MAWDGAVAIPVGRTKWRRSGSLATSFVSTPPCGADIPAIPLDIPWYALRVRSNFEKKAACVLESTGFDHLLPTYRCRSYWSDRVKWLDRPLFPGYVFCRFDHSRWVNVLRTPGVIDVVSFGSKPAPVDPSEIAALQQLMRSGMPLYPRMFLHVGQKVFIRHGPLAGVEGVVESLGKNLRIVVSVSLLQRSVAAEIDADMVETIQ